MLTPFSRPDVSCHAWQAFLMARMSSSVVVNMVSLVLALQELLI
jgi:hypothetical protein